MEKSSKKVIKTNKIIVRDFIESDYNSYVDAISFSKEEKPIIGFRSFKNKEVTIIGDLEGIRISISDKKGNILEEYYFNHKFPKNGANNFIFDILVLNTIPKIRNILLLEGFVRIDI